MTSGRFFEKPTEQSKTKAAIVSDYFYAWAKVILSSQDRSIAYIDLFAGPGKYEDGTSSTPLLVLEKAIQDTAIRKSLIAVFGDKAKRNIVALQANIHNLPGIDTLAHAPQVRQLEVGDQVTETFWRMRLDPSLLFLDPWGYKGLSLQLVDSVIKDWACECIFFFNYNRINPALGNRTVESRMNDLFGQARADKLRIRLRSLRPKEREKAILQGISDAVTQKYGKYVLTFCFKKDSGTRPSHYLVFVTKHPLGYEIMKEIMAKRSSTHDEGVASFEFNPVDARQARLELPHAIDELARVLLTRFAGRTLKMHQIYEEHNVGTHYIKKNYKDALARLELNRNISTETHKKGTFGPNVQVTFPPVEGQ